MEHYFIETEHTKNDFFEITQKFFGKEYHFVSCNDVFSKNSVDYGTFVLINAIVKTQKIAGKVLDIGCGYGAIGIVLGDVFKDAKFVLTDVNNTAVELSKQNVQKNSIKNIEYVKKSFAYDDIFDNFDYILSNPPIKAGKETLTKILLGAYDRLNKNGKLIFVIKKKFGEDSIKHLLENNLFSVEIIKRDSGYYVLSASKLEKV